ncbi:transcriptional repressor proteinral negative regulator of transcription subunit 4 [Sporothrix curviconia]|uniref:Transcriptional repressor proteinral negative regulator of transcription subunit 4 n=1 Tax=Sporothrix curviconia TaxID=1260050 RepID=A0ABP0ARQ8_9PEZI
MASYPYGIDSPLRSGTPSFPPGFGHIQPLQHPTPTPPPGFSRPMTPATSLTPTNMNSSALSKPPVPLVPVIEPTAARETQDSPKQQEEDQQKSRPLPGKREASRIVSVASNTSNSSEASTPATETAKPAKPTETASSAPAAQEAPVPATPVSKLGAKASVLQDEDFPALDAAAMSAAKSNAAAQAKSSKPSTPVGKKTIEKRPVPAVLNIAAASKPSASTGSEASPAASEKYAPADSAAFPSLPTPAAPWSPVVRSTPQHKTLRVVQATKPSEAASPGHTTLATIAAADNAKHVASASSTPTTTHALLANRQPSVLLANRPSTPASEIVSISDNASVVSASISASRAGSPPPPISRIGSAAVRTTTKSQQRKQRKQASKMDAAAVVEAATTTSSSLVGPSTNDKDAQVAEIAPIMGRKKKQKKEKPAPSPTPAKAPAAEASAAAETATPAKTAKEQKEAKGAKQTSAAKKKEDAKAAAVAETAAAAKAAETARPSEATKTMAKTSTNASAAPAAAAKENVAATSATSAAAAAAVAPLAPVAPAQPPAPVQSAFEKEHEILQAYLREAAEVAGSTTLSVAKESSDGVGSGYPKGIANDHWARFGGTVHSVAQDMATRGLIDKNVDKIPLLQPFTKLSSPRTTNRKRPIKGDALIPPDVLFDKDDLNNIIAGKPVRKDVDDVRILVTPNGDCLRNLTEAEEERFMALQSSVGNNMASPLSYMHPRYEETGGFSLIAKRAIPCGLPSYYPAKSLAPPGTAGQIIFDPLSKIQREEAVYWINQYVLPRLNLLPQSEAASWQSMLVDTGVPQAIGTTTLAPWIYYTPDARYGMPSSGGVSSSSIAANSTTTNTNGHAWGSGLDDDGPLTLRDGKRLVPSPYTTRYPSRYGPTVDRDSADLKNDLESSVHAMSVEDAERSLIEARREVKVFERALVQLVKMNEMLLKSDDHLAKFAAGTDSRVWTGLSATLLVLGWLLGGVMGVALGLAGWAGVLMVQVAGYVWDKVATGDVAAKEGEQVVAVALAAAVAVE